MYYLRCSIIHRINLLFTFHFNLLKLFAVVVRSKKEQRLLVGCCQNGQVFFILRTKLSRFSYSY